MVTQEHIREMYAHLVKTNSSIPDEALDFMLNSCTQLLDTKTETYDLVSFKVSGNTLKGRAVVIEQPKLPSKYFRVVILPPL